MMRSIFTHQFDAPGPTPAEIAEVISIFSLSRRPEEDLRAARENGLLEKVIPEFAPCWGPDGEQDPRWHPEGDVFQHTCRVLANAAEYDRSVRFAAGFHDLGKPWTIHRIPGTAYISNHGHEYVGAKMVERCIGPRLGLDAQEIEGIAWLCRYHMVPQLFGTPKAPPMEFYRHLADNPLFPQLLELHVADVNGALVAAHLRRNNAEALRALIPARGGHEQ